MNRERIFKKEILQQEAYPIEETPCRIKLDANENPYTLSPALRQEMFQYLQTISVNRYPDPGAADLKARLSERLGVPDTMILIGNGSDELIQMILTAFNSFPSGGVVIPVPTFAMYKICAVNMSHRVIEVPLNHDFDLDGESMLDAMKQANPDLVFLSYPNNPTGNCFNREHMERILNASRGIVVVDEAYFNFSEKTFLPDIDRWDNLIVLRTLSKVGFASIRLGVLVGNPGVIQELNKVRLPYNINAFSQAIALFVLEHEEAFQHQIEHIIRSRKDLFDGLTRIEGITPYATDSNFILFSCATDKNKVYKELLDRGILIKSFSSPGLLNRCMRVTVGTDAENGEFLGALRDIVRL